MLLDSTEETTTVACSYLLSIVISGVDPQVLKVKYEYTSQALISSLDSHSVQAPLVRSVLSCMQVLLLAQDSMAWTASNICTKLLYRVIALSTDSRPKVRKRAHEAVRQILNNPPPPTSLHPASGICLDFATRFLSSDNSHSKDERTLRDTQIMHLLAFLRTILPVVVGHSSGNDDLLKKLNGLAASLLKLPSTSSGSGNIMITQSVFSALSCFFGKPIDVSTASNIDASQVSFTCY